MFEFFFICGIVWFLFVVLKHLIDKSAYKRKIARIQAEIDARQVGTAPLKREDVLRSHRSCDRDEIRRGSFREHDEKPRPTRIHAKPEIDKFLGVKRNTRVIVFDVETNGLSGNYSVLSCSAIKYNADPNSYEVSELDRFNRYYYPVEQFDPAAISVNGLTKEVIAEKRGTATYPEHFCMDSDFETFCSDTRRFVAHNISFDCRFVPFIGNKKKLCTMMTNMDIVAVEYMKWKKEWKWPKLSETAVYYGIRFSERELHSSMADAEITAKIFMKMLETARIS